MKRHAVMAGAALGVVLAFGVLAVAGLLIKLVGAPVALLIDALLALGSALASIGLTIPVVAAVSFVFPHPLVLGLPPKEMVLLTLTLIVGVLTLGSGRATVMQGAVHLVIFAVYLFTTIVP